MCAGSPVEASPFRRFSRLFSLTSSVSIFTSQRRVEIQTTSEMTLYFTIINYIPYSLN